MNFLRQVFLFLLGLLLLLAVGIGLYLLLKTMWGAFSALNPQTGAALITGFFTITVSISAVALGRYLEKAKEVEVAYREKRLKVYEDFVDRFYTLVQSDESDELTPEEKQEGFTAFLRDFNRKILLWAGSETVHTYVVMMHRLADDATSASAVFSMEEFYKAMRSDLGLENNKLIKGDLLALWLRSHDCRKFLAACKTNPNIRLGELFKNNS